MILRVSEARDLGDVDRFAFYDHMKAYTAAPPDVLRVDEKHLREYAVFNCCGVVITTNHKSDGIYLPADDRRHFVAWSDKTKEDFTPAYWNRLWNWYDEGGFGHVAAYLAALDIADFDAKAPPPKTDAFWDIVDANRAPEDAELADVLDRLGNPDATTLDRLAGSASEDFKEWLNDRRNRRVSSPSPRSRRLCPGKKPRCRRRALENRQPQAGRLRPPRSRRMRPHCSRSQLDWISLVSEVSDPCTIST